MIQGGVPASFRTVLALVGVVLSYATVVAGPPSAAWVAFDDICIAGGPACELPVSPDRGDAVYATPAEVDCPAPAGAHRLIDGAAIAQGQPTDDGQAATGACSLPVLDFRYRVSRLPESERPSGAFQPQRARRSSRTAACTGLPPEHGTQLSSGMSQPAAIYAALQLLPPPSEGIGAGASAVRTSRVLEPLDKPPRA